MRFALFYHSIVSDWNHGNAHFLRGVVSELLARKHHVRVFEPDDGWSLTQLLGERGPSAIDDFHAAFPHLASDRYNPAALDLDRMLDAVDVVIAHEWTAGEVLRRLADYRRRHPRCRVLFHDTHHRVVSDEDSLDTLTLQQFDGVLAFGASLAERYRRLGHTAWTWHEAADTRVFYPRSGTPSAGDLVWIGNWGDNERAEELREFLLEPVASLGLRARVHGVRYPPEALQQLAAAGIEYGGWAPNHTAPEIFAQFRVTVHVPRRPYVAMLPGIPTIRPFEALACGIPLISAPWGDVEGLFRPDDFVMVQNGAEMTTALRSVLNDAERARTLAARGLETILARHTCAHRVDELFSILEAICPPDRLPHSSAPASSPRTGTEPRPTTAASFASCTNTASM